MVMPSHYESFGLVSLEALACGIPVVATPVGVMDTIIQEGLNGQLVANGDAKLLAKAIDKVTSLSPALSADAIRQTVQDVWLAEYRLCHRQGIRRNSISGKSDLIEFWLPQASWRIRNQTNCGVL
ncbi:MAG: glycosyltransferase [Desulfobacterales bacterium]|nr:glycosyltransferase [Desulfobacterales bacterium]